MSAQDQELEELKLLERTVPEDLSEWPRYAQVLYVQTSLLTRQMAAVQAAVSGEKGLKETAHDHERRLKSLEAGWKWAAGIATAIFTAIGVAIATGNLKGGH